MSSRPPPTPLDVASMSITDSATDIVSDANSIAPQPNEIVLYWGSGSPQAWRVLICLEEKQITFRSVCISFSSGILKTPLFQQLNPRMRIPILVDNIKGAVVYESLAILAYLEQYYPVPSLMPSDLPARFAAAQTRLQEINEILSCVGELVVYLRRVPLEHRNEATLRSKWACVERELSLWENYIDGRYSYLLGTEPYLCDFALFTNLAYAVRCGLKLDGLYPKLACFYSNLCSRPSIDKTWPPHWKSTCGQPVLAICYNGGSPSNSTTES